MLRKDKNKLKLLLSMLFFSAGYFRVKSNNTVTIKKHWWSWRKLVITFEDIFSQYVPNSLGTESDIEVVNYQEKMSEVMDDSVDKKINIAFNCISSFVNDTEYKGCMVEWDFIPTTADHINRLYENIVTGLKESYNQIVMEIEFKRPRSFQKTSIISLKALPPTSIISIQEVLSRQREKISFDQIGRVITGDSDFDDHVQRILRVSHVQTGFT
jgi:hypothetical protein